MSLEILFISDTHFGHRAICKYRTQFKTPQEHDEFIIEKWNKRVRKASSIIWVLGDMCIQNKYYDFPTLISRLRGNIHLITGNHCYLPAYNHNKIKVMNGIFKKYDYWLSHAPIHPEELRSKKNIHGHVHYKSIKDYKMIDDGNSGFMMAEQLDDRYINVCCEKINYTPISLEEIRERFGNGKY